MRVFLSADIEGITGVCSPHEADDRGSPAWERACEKMRADVDAALEGARAAGAAEVVVNDGHYDGDNLHAEGLPAGVTLLSGAQHDLSMMQGIEPVFDAAVFVGYHAMAGTEAGVLAHTWNAELASATVLEPGGARRPVGEFGLNAAVAGAFGVPVVFVSGDDRLAAEAAAFVPGIETAVVKEGVSRTAALFRDPAVARASIREGVERALRRLGQPGSPAPLRWDGCALELRFASSELCDRAARFHGAARRDGLHLVVDGADWPAVYRAFVACATLAEH
jgi:D-amino peptidase